MKKLMRLKYILLLVVSLLLVGCPPFPVIILNPHNGDQFEVGKEISFKGLARDLKDGALSEDSLVWESSIDGQIGTGKEFTEDNLSEGTHIITLTATNSQGESNSSSITITIGEVTPTTTSSSTSTIPYGPTTSTVISSTTTITDISGELEIDKIMGPLGVPMEAELMIPFHVEGIEIVAEGGPWETPIAGDDVPDGFGCTVDYTGEFSIRNVGGELNTSDPSEPFLYFTFEVYETEYWTRTCPDGVSSDEWVSEWWESDCGMNLVDGYTWGGPPAKFLYTLHLDTTP